MRWLALALALAGCDREPSFDDRYDDAQADIEARAASIDRQLAADATEAPNSQSAPPSEPAPTPQP